MERTGARRLAAEGLVIVASILLAFAIDAAWDGYQERRFRDELVAGLRAEFTSNRERLDSAIADAAAWEPGTVPVDSMRR